MKAFREYETVIGGTILIFGRQAVRSGPGKPFSQVVSFSRHSQQWQLGPIATDFVARGELWIVPVGLGLSAVAVVALGLAGMQITQGHRPTAPVVIPHARPKAAPTLKEKITSKTNDACIAYRDISASPKAGEDDGVATGVIAVFLRQPGRTPKRAETTGLEYAIALVPDPRHTRLSTAWPAVTSGSGVAPAEEAAVEGLPRVAGDLQNYKLQHPEFPQDSTANQWFTESQFEGYRGLGQWIVNELSTLFA